MPPVIAGAAFAAGWVAVLIPVFNDDGRLDATLRSLCGQGVPMHAIVVDDGSVPPLKIEPDLLDFPVTLLRQEQNGGIERALNVGLAHILDGAFEWVARLDNGDLCHPDRLRTQRQYLESHPEVGLVGSHVEWVTRSGQTAFRLALPEAHAEIVRGLHHTVCLIHPTVMFRVDVIRDVGVYSCDYPAAEDYELFWRIARHVDVANIPIVLVRTRLDREGISISRRRRQLLSKLRIQLRFFDFLEPLSYVGVLKTLMLLVLPYSLVVFLKRQWHRES